MVEGFLLVNWCIARLTDSSQQKHARTLRGRLRQCGLTADGHPPILELEGHELVDSLSWWAVEAPWSTGIGGRSDILWEALGLCCHTCLHPSTEFCVMRTQIHDDVCGVAWNCGNLCGGSSGACKANDWSAVHHSSVTNWNV